MPNPIVQRHNLGFNTTAAAAPSPVQVTSSAIARARPARGYISRAWCRSRLPRLASASRPRGRIRPVSEFIDPRCHVEASVFTPRPSVRQMHDGVRPDVPASVAFPSMTRPLPTTSPCSTAHPVIDTLNIVSDTFPASTRFPPRRSWTRWRAVLRNRHLGDVPL